MESNVKVIKSNGQLLLVTKDNKHLSIQQDMRVLSPFKGNRDHVIVSVDFKIPLKDFCSESIDDLKTYIDIDWEAVINPAKRQER